MPNVENQGSFLNLISIRRGQVSAVDNDQELDDIELLQKHVALRVTELLSVQSPESADPAEPAPESHAPLPPPLLSIAWFRNLLDILLCCEAEFMAVLVLGRDQSQFSKPPLDRLIPEFLDRTVKALDLCHAVGQGTELLRQWQKLAEIAVASLQSQSPVGEGQVRRARKALSTLLTSMAVDDRENGTAACHGKATDRTLSLGRRHKAVNFRPLSSPFAKNWSAAKQINAISANLVAPRGADATGPALPVYIMSTIVAFAMWVLVAAIPCQERNGLTNHVPLPKQTAWAQPMSSLQEKIGEEWKRKEKKGAAGLLEEIQRMEKAAQWLVEFADSFVFPLEEDKESELRAQVAELDEICRKMEEGLTPLRQQLREVYHKMMRSRAEVLQVVDQATKSSAPVPY